MRTATRAVLLSLLLCGIGQAATRSDINTIEAAEKIRYLSQKIAKSYLYLYSRPQHVEIKKELYTLVDDLGNNFSIISSSANDNNTKDLLKYLEYNKDNIVTLLSKKVSKKNASLMLDYSEILLEGGNSIAHAHSYKFNNEETMLMNIKKYEYLAERLGKFYMASSIGALSQSNRKKMDESKKMLDTGLRTIMKYKYPAKLEGDKEKLNLFWDTNKHILAHAYDIYIPNLMNTSNGYFEQLLTKFALYHSKRQ